MAGRVKSPSLITLYLSIFTFSPFIILGSWDVNLSGVISLIIFLAVIIRFVFSSSDRLGGKAKYWIMNGVQRWKIAKELGLKEVPLKVYDVENAEALEIALSTADAIPEHPLDRAIRIKRMSDVLTKQNISREESLKRIAEIFGWRSTKGVEQYLKIANSPLFDPKRDF